VTIETDVAQGWLSREELDNARERLPIVYVEAVPVRVDDRGQVTSVGLLLRMRPDGSISNSIVSGRVWYGERVRDALIRNLEKDLGAMALPRLPLSLMPITVAEYFPSPEVTGFVDPRQHAISLVYVVACTGDCQPTQSALDLKWLTPAEALSAAVAADMTGGQHRLIQMALAHCGISSDAGLPTQG
jgi:ADP-ribose pyrophosphatase YjhB (NUDIX family)